VRRFVAAAALGGLALLGSAAIAQSGRAPSPYPTIVISLPPAPATPSPDPITRERELARARLIACVNEQKVADTALVQTAKADGVVAGVMKRLGDTRFTFDTLLDNAQPSYVQTPAPVGVGTLPTPLPFTTPVSTIMVARDAAQGASKPYWTGTRKLLDASGDLEKNVKAAAAAVDQLQRAVNIDPDPQRRAQVQTIINALTDAIIKQAPLVRDVEKFVLREDTQLSVAEVEKAGTMGGSNQEPQINSALLNRDPESDGYKLLHHATAAHDATLKALKQANNLNGTAFAECAVPHPQATPR